MTIGHHDEHLHDVPAFALLGGLAIYLLGLVGFRYRHVHTLNRHRLGLAIVLLFLVPVATAVPALVTAGGRRRTDLGDDCLRAPRLRTGRRARAKQILRQRTA